MDDKKFQRKHSDQPRNLLTPSSPNFLRLLTACSTVFRCPSLVLEKNLSAKQMIFSSTDCGVSSLCGTGKCCRSMSSIVNPAPVCRSQTSACLGNPSFRISSAPMVP